MLATVPGAADRVVSGIYDKALMLARFPRLGYRYEPIDDREIRIVLYGNYRITYLLTEDETVQIIGVFHAALEIEHYLR